MTIDFSEYLTHLRILTSVEKAIRSAAFRIIREGRRAEADDIAQHIGLESGEAAERIADLAARGYLELDSEGRVVGSRGLSLLPKWCALDWNGLRYYTWCAADAIGIPAVLGGEARVETGCRICGTDVTVRIMDGEVFCEQGKPLRIWLKKPVPGMPMFGGT